MHEESAEEIKKDNEQTWFFFSSLSACSLWLWHYLDAVCMLNYM